VTTTFSATPINGVGWGNSCTLACLVDTFLELVLDLDYVAKISEYVYLMCLFFS